MLSFLGGRRPGRRFVHILGFALIAVRWLLELDALLLATVLGIAIVPVVRVERGARVLGVGWLCRVLRRRRLVGLRGPLVRIVLSVAVFVARCQPARAVRRRQARLPPATRADAAGKTCVSRRVARAEATGHLREEEEGQDERDDQDGQENPASPAAPAGVTISVAVVVTTRTAERMLASRRVACDTSRWEKLVLQVARLHVGKTHHAMMVEVVVIIVGRCFLIEMLRFEHHKLARSKSWGGGKVGLGVVGSRVQPSRRQHWCAKPPLTHFRFLLTVPHG